MMTSFQTWTSPGGGPGQPPLAKRSLSNCCLLCSCRPYDLTGDLRQAMGLPLRSNLADVFLPQLGMFLYEIRHHRETFLGVEVNNLNSERAQPLDSALKIAALADDYRPKTKLPYQPATVP